MAATVMAAIANYLRETIDDGLTDVLPEIDPFMMNVWKTSLGVYETQQRGGGIGRAYQAIHTYEAGLSGTQEWVSALGGASDALMSGASGGDGVTVYALPTAGWPAIPDMAAGGTIQATYALVEGRGAYPIPIHLMGADRLNAAIASTVATIVRGAAKRCNLAMAHCLWKLNTSNAIGSFTAASTAEISTGTALTLTSGRIRSFYRGLTVSIFDDSSGPNAIVDASGKVLIVYKVDPANGVVYVKSTDGAAGTSGITGAAKYWLVPRNSRVSTTALSNAPYGLVDFHKSSGTVAGGISLTYYPELASIVNPSQTGPCTATKLSGVLAQMGEDFGVELDTIVTTQGVIQGMVQNVEDTQQLQRLDVQGQAMKIVAGYAPVEYVFNGKRFRILVSPMCPKGNVWILKLSGGNYVKYTPPKYPAVRTKGEFSGEVEFVGPLFGSTSEVMPQYYTNGSTVTLTDKLIVPYVQRLQVGVRNPRAIHLSTFQENFGL